MTGSTNKSACVGVQNASRVPMCTWVQGSDRKPTDDKPHNKTEGRKIVSCMRNKTMEQIRKWGYKTDSNGLPFEDTWDSSEWAPVVDGVELPMTPTTAIEKGKVLANITILLGSNADEGDEVRRQLALLCCSQLLCTYFMVAHMHGLSHSKSRGT